MIEFGSDFHYIKPSFEERNTLRDFYPSANYYVDGRQALIHLYFSQGWERLWVPMYFCYDVIASLEQAGIKLVFYSDNPGYDKDDMTLEAAQRNGHLKRTDVILRINYFGLRSYRSLSKLSVAAIVEDHTHDLIGGWARCSSADWCIASLRKTLPIPEGGILWSPKGLCLPEAPEMSEENERIATIRWKSMELKSKYLKGENVDKALFRVKFVNTEEFFDMAPVCSLDKRSKEYLQSFNIMEWYHKKLENWELLKDIKKDGVRIMRPENMGCYPFSLVLLFDDFSERNRVRKALIEHHVYPAILWTVPQNVSSSAKDFSERMLSIHCDGRYSEDDIRQLADILNRALEE